MPKQAAVPGLYLVGAIASLREARGAMASNPAIRLTSGDERAAEPERLPEYMVSATVEAAVRIAQWEASPAKLLSGQGARLVREVLVNPVLNN